MPIWSIAQQPEELWTNGDDTWIQRIIDSRGPDTTLEEVLTVVQSGGGGVDKNAWNLRKSAPASSLIAEPEEIWTNGDR